MVPPNLSLPRQTADQARHVERPETVMVQPADIRLEERTQVRHAVLEHGDAVDADPEREALHRVRIEAAIAQDVRVDHPAAQDLQPVVALAEANLAALAGALDVDLGRRLGEREERWAEAHLHPI